MITEKEKQKNGLTSILLMGGGIVGMIGFAILNQLPAFDDREKYSDLAYNFIYYSTLVGVVAGFGAFVAGYLKLQINNKKD